MMDIIKEFIFAVLFGALGLDLIFLIEILIIMTMEYEDYLALGKFSYGTEKFIKFIYKYSAISLSAALIAILCL